MTRRTSSQRGTRRLYPRARMLRLEQLESRAMLSIANGVDYQFDVVAKASPDQWYTGLGGEYVPITDPQPAGAIAKVNQDYVWGMTHSGDYLWFASGGNVLAQASGAIGGVGGEPYATAIWAAEYGQSQYPNVPDELRPYLGDWRPPQMHRYNMATDTYEKLEVDDPLLEQTLGIRSAGANEDIVLFAGPNLYYFGMNVFAFNAKTGEYLGSQHLLTYSNIRDWVNVEGQLYTAVSRTFSTSGEGSVLRWTGSLNNPFSFTEVGRLDLEGANLCAHEGRLYVSTWPLNYGSLMGILGFRSDATAGLWMSPELGTDGLSYSDRTSWTKVWSINDYEPDAVIAKSYGGGSLASYGGYLYWGTMQVPATGSVVLAEAYPDIDISKLTLKYDATYGYSTSERVAALFRCKDFASSTDNTVELLYGDAKLWSFVAGSDPTTDPGHWELKSNNMGGSDGIYGRAGFGDANNRYIWSMAVYTNPVSHKSELYVGTFDVGTLTAGDYYVPLQGDSIAFNTAAWVNYAWYATLGADLWVFDDTTSGAEAASTDGLGNALNHGVRNMEVTDYGLFLGTASASNLLTEAYDPPSQPLHAGGWELVHLQVTSVDPIQLDGDHVAENSPTGTAIGTFSVAGSATYTYTLTDNAGGRFQVVGNQLQVADGSQLVYESRFQHTIRVQASGSDGSNYEREFTVYLDNVNEPPTNISFSATPAVPENSLAGVLVGTLTTTDPDVALDTYAYALLDNDGGRFTLSGRRIYVAAGAVLDYDTQPNRTVLVRVTDAGGNTLQKTLTIPLTNVNEAPTDLSLSVSQIAENSPAGTVVGTLSGLDPDAGDTLSYALMSDANGRFQIVGNELQVANASLLNYEANTSHTITLQVTDAAGLSYQKNVTISVTNVNEQPTAVSLDNLKVPQQSATGTVIGTLTTADPDQGDTFSYALADTVGGRFKLVGNQLQVADGTLLVGGNTYTVQVTASDAGGLSVTNSFTITVTAPNNLTAIDVQEGATQRSYIRYVDLAFLNSSGLGELITEGRVKLTKYDLNGANGKAVSLTNVLSTTANKIRFDFGSAGIGGNANSNTGDGYYEIAVDLDRNGSYETLRHFYRLFGDVNGDRTVNSTDVSLVRAAIGQKGPNLATDVNGSLTVDALDWLYTRRANGRKLKSGLVLDD